MILQFKVKNFLSVREEQTLDFTASSDKTYEEYAIVKIKNSQEKADALFLVIDTDTLVKDKEQYAHYLSEKQGITYS